MAERARAISTGGPIGVGGWLLLFCLSLTVFSPLLTMINLVSNYGQTSPLFGRFPGLYAITILDCILSDGIMCFSVYAGISLWRKQYNAVQTAKQYLITFLIYTIVASFLPFMAGLPSEANAVMLAEVMKGSVRSLVFFCYLVFLFKQVTASKKYFLGS